MQVKRISEHIWSLKTWMIVPINVWVVADEEGITLVDAGMPMMTKGIIKFIEQHNGLSLQRILLTHGHSDHVGAIKGILKKYEVPVYAHSIEIPYMEGEIIYPKRKKLENNLPKTLTKPLLEDDSNTLMKIGGLTPYFTPGHSPGHVVYYHEQDQVLLAGDLFTSKKGKLKPPMAVFTADMKQALASASIIKHLKPKQLEVCHGNTVYHPFDQLEEYEQRKEKILGGK
ncbi:Glyoxylase, beta-lactamase superfamily II [Psychrobacillus sp. OK028]|uniref:MBL fold metallo-hydrolase n=1 Tax=Psychrobacillus sp. OK028 TaxID=1884359 RepID=UPI00088769BF|nr:MBL fold metallo-hydrolase [Psychrobacillus sp. OK028]SDN62973.1 Glyoxylase, beta-lactamase superfamily II [Psychrobacillus sp. OK028]